MREILDELLPTKWSKWVATTTITVTFAAPFLYEGLQKIGIHVEAFQSPYLRLLFASVSANAGLILLLALILRHVSEISSRLQAKESPAKEVAPKINIRLDSMQEALLQLLCAHDDITSAQVAKVIGVGEQLVTYHFSDLESKRFVHGSYSTVDPTEWSIIQNGRAYLMKHGLLK
ncbi:hypothetical protein [Thiobacillus thioparus]|uniref:hypothetical protein n=1 Tax=Thiobacillus thioparus TaxID=931 RepID=UPI0012FC4708|nr:hypothetical protein [Thiobacillus thioparus]